MIYTETRENSVKKIRVTIRLNDECKNGHDDFSITCDGWYKDKRHNCHGDIDFGGCCHDEILKLFPEFSPFVKLHLSDCEGVPMYAVESGFYFLKEGKHDYLRKHLRCKSDEIFKQLCFQITDKKHFAYLLEKFGFYKQWKKEANEAIAILEALTGEKYQRGNPRKRFELTPQDKTELEQRIYNGYYSIENVAKRDLEKLQAEKEKKRNEIIDDCNKRVEKAINERDVRLYILDWGFGDNFIYYDHSNKCVFNWLNYKDKITQEQFIDFINNLDRSKLPDGILFEIK